MEVFTEYNIVFCKEEGDTLQANQGHDHSAAKSDKLVISKLLDVVRGYVHVVVGQYQLMVICLSALEVVPDTSWISLFKKVNLHPDHQTSFPDWAKHIDDKILTGGRFYQT